MEMKTTQLQDNAMLFGARIKILGTVRKLSYNLLHLNLN